MHVLLHVYERVFRRGIIFGSVMASFTVEDFSLNRLLRLERAEVADRYRDFRELMRVDGGR